MGTVQLLSFSLESLPDGGSVIGKTRIENPSALLDGPRWLSFSSESGTCLIHKSQQSSLADLVSMKVESIVESVTILKKWFQG